MMRKSTRSSRRRELRSLRRLRLEPLEDRRLLAVTATVDGNNVLTVELDAANDQAFITNNGSNEIRVGTTANGSDKLADTAGIVAIVVNDTGAAGNQQVDFDGSTFSLTQFGGDSVSVSGIELLHVNTGITGTGLVTMSADEIQIAGSISTGSDVNLLPAASNLPIDLGSAVDNPGVLDLSDAELDFVTANILRIGSTTTGDITFTAPISPALTSTLSLISGDAILDENNTIPDVAVTNLALRAKNGIANSGGSTSQVNLETAVDTVAALNTDSQSIAIVETYNSGDLIVGTVDGVVGVQSLPAGGRIVLVETDNGDLTINAPVFSGTTRGVFLAAEYQNGNTGGSQVLTNNSTISSSLGPIELRANNMSLSGGTISAGPGDNVILRDGNDAGDISILLGGSDTLTTLGLTDADLDTITTTGTLQIGNGNAGPIDVVAPIDLTDGPSIPTLSLITGGAILGSGGNLLTTNALNATVDTTIGASGDAFYFDATELSTSGGGDQYLSELNSTTVGDDDLDADGSTVILVGGTFVTTSAGGDIQSNTSVRSGATLAGTGTVLGAVALQSGGSIAPGVSPGILNMGSVAFVPGANLNMEINGTSPGTQHDQLNVTGSVTLTDATLNLSGSLVPNNAVLQSFVIINNDGTDAVSGTFNGLPETAPINLNGNNLYISYNGGDGNDVVLYTQPVVNGTDGSDTLQVTPLAGGDLQYQYLPGGPVVTLTAPVPAFTFNGRGGDDVMIVQANGNAFPAGGIFYHGGGQDLTNPPTPSNGDVLQVFGSGQSAVYTPSPSTTGNGQIGVAGGGTITFTGLEPVDMSGFGTLTLAPAGADDVLTIANGFDATSGTTPALVISGMTGGFPIEALHAWNNGTLVVDTATIDDGDDTVTVSSANNAHGNGSLVILTGSGTDVTNVNGAIQVTDDVVIDSVDITVGAGASIVAGVDVTLDAENELTINGPLTATANDVELYSANDDVIINASITAGEDVIATAFLGDVLFTTASPMLAADDVELDADGVVDIDGPITAGEDIELQLKFFDQGSVFIDANLTANGNIVMLPDETDSDVLIGSGAIITSDADMSGGEDILIFPDRDLIQSSGSLVSNAGAIGLLTLTGDISIVSAVSNGANQIAADGKFFGTAADANLLGDAALQIWPGDNAIVSGIVSTMGDVEVVSAFGDVVLSDINAGTNLVFLQAFNGAVVDNNGPADNVTASGLAIESDEGIGDGDPLETAVGTLAARNISSGNIAIANTTSALLTIGSVGLLSGVSNGGADVRLTAFDLNVAENIDAADDVALGSNNPVRTFAVGSGPDVKGSGITTGTAAYGLDDDELDLITAGGQRRLLGNNAADMFNVHYTGSDTEPLNVLGLAGDDQFFVAPSTTMPINLDGGVPSAPALPGDTLHLDMTGALPVVIVDTIGGYAISASTAVVSFQEMETLDLCDDSGEIDNADIGDLYVRTTNDRERITFTSWNDTGVKLRIDNLDVGTSTTYPQHFGLVGGLQMLSQLLVYAQDGNDLVSVAGHVVDAGLNPIPVEFHGEDGDDYLTGANGNDVLVGGPGNDRVLGGEGDNLLYGDGDELDLNSIPIELPTDGDDYVSGRTGNDVIFGGGGTDRLYGSDGNDYIHAGSGNDLVVGGLDDDVLIGADGNDNLSGNYGNDILLGGDGDDFLYGRQGDDVLLGGSDYDWVRGNDGNDLVVGGNASNVGDSTTDAALRAILADWVAGNPSVPGGLGMLLTDGVEDLLIGDLGDDAFHEGSGADPEDRVYDFRTGDTLLP